MNIRLPIAPMSVNEAWQGKRFKTPRYKSYEREVLLQLPAGTIPEPPYRIAFEFGLSSPLADWDNPVKPLQDILQKRYGFNDRDIVRAEVAKVKVPKGKEYFAVTLETTTRPMCGIGY